MRQRIGYGPLKQPLLANLDWLRQSKLAVNRHRGREDDADRSNVLRKENSGRQLQHVSVARSLARVAAVKGNADQSVHVTFPDDYRFDGGSGHHLVLFAQEQHQGGIVGAVTIPL